LALATLSLGGMLPSVSQLARKLVTEDEFLSLPETMQRQELLDGELIVSPSPSYQHQEMLGRLYVALRQWAATQPGPVTVCMAPLDVRVAPNRVLQPDAFVSFARLDPKQQGPIAQVPELCVEVLSSNRVYDRLTKRFVYGEAGVQELWTVEPTGAVERWWGPGLSQSELLTERLVSPVLPGFELDLAGLRVE
jgi:Uma2 family endonuclease